MGETSLELIHKRRNTAIRILSVLFFLSLLGIGTLHTLLFFSEKSNSSLQSEIISFQEEEKTLMQDRDFVQYRKNKTFLSTVTKRAYSTYLRTLYEAVGSSISIKSIQTQQKSDGGKNSTQLYLTAESSPSLPDTKALLTSIEGKKDFFLNPEISTISAGKNESGAETFTFPLTLTLGHGANTTEK